MSILLISANLECCECQAKIRKVLECVKEEYSIEKIEYDQKINMVIVRGKFDAKRLCKIWCMAGKVVKGIRIVDVWPPPQPPPPTPPTPPPKPECDLVPLPYPLPYPLPCQCPPQQCHCCPKPPSPPPKEKCKCGKCEPSPPPCYCSSHEGCGCGKPPECPPIWPPPTWPQWCPPGPLPACGPH